MASVKFYLSRPKENGKLKKTDCSIFARVTLDKKNRFEITTDEKIEPKFWDFNGQCVKSSYRGHYEVNIYLSDYKTKLLTLYREHRELPFDKFKKLVFQKASASEKKTLFIALEQFLKAYKAEKESKTLGKYNTLAAQIKAFDSQYPIDLINLDYKFYDAFKEHLFSIPNPNYLKYRLIKNGDVWDMVEGDKGEVVSIFNDTVYKYFVNLITFCKWAKKRGYQVDPSYEGWEILTSRYQPITLLESELEALESFEFTIDSVKPFIKKHGNPAEVIKAVSVARDYLVFECRTGQRISDIKRFDLKDLNDFRWTFYPYKGRRLSTKTRTVYFKGFCAPALSILAKYNWKMPVISDQKLNDNIKKACKIVGINSPTEIFRYALNKRIRIQGPKYEFLSSHTGRKTFVTIGLQYLKPKSVKDLAGMSWATLRHYEGDAEGTNIEKDLESMGESKSIMRKAQ